jgi:N-acetylmuramoyl-L-alanine amidase
MKRRVNKLTNKVEIRKPDPALTFRSKLTPLKNIDMIILHHMAHKTADIQAVHNYHRTRTYTNSSGKTGYWSGIGYNYFITFDGTIYEARGLHEGAHTYGYNNHSIGIGFQGDFQQQPMPDAQLAAGSALCSKLLQDHSLTEKDIKLHKDLAVTSCPGKNFRFTQLKQILATAQVMNPDPAPAPDPVANPDSNTIYTVQVGAFKVKDNAEKLKQQLIRQGYKDTFIK